LKITWASNLILDLHLHRTTQIEVLKNLEMLGNEPFLIGMRSRRRLTQQESKELHTLQVPIRFYPFISEIIYLFVLELLLPVHIILRDPDFIIMDPEISIFGSAIALMISKLRKKPKFILDIRSTPIDVKGVLGHLHELQFTLSILYAKKVFSGITIITPLMKKEVCTKYSIESCNVGVWTSGVSSSFFNPDIWQTEGQKLRLNLGLSNRFVVFYHGHITVERGILTLFNAMVYLKNINPNYLLFLLGDGPLVYNLQKKIRDYNMENNVIIHPAVPYSEVPKFISMSDICIIPLPNNALWRFQSPLKLLEYLSMGKVIIVSDIPAHRSVVKQSNCCLYLSSVSSEEIIKLLTFAKKNEEYFQGWGESGRKIVTSNYTWTKVAADFQEYLKRFL